LFSAAILTPHSAYEIRVDVGALHEATPGDRPTVRLDHEHVERDDT